MSEEHTMPTNEPGRQPADPDVLVEDAPGLDEDESEEVVPEDLLA